MDDAPALDELEVTLLGPGYGEAVLVHLGGGKWLAIDSARAPDGACASLQYLQALGVNVADAVICVVITHFDDDHIRGAADLVRAAQAAKIVTSAAILEKDFLTLVGSIASDRTRSERTGVREIKAITEELATSGRTLTYATHAKTLFEYGTLPIPQSQGVRIRTLSPSDREFEFFLEWVRAQQPNVGQTLGRLPKRSRNDVSIVVEVAAEGEAILLGADLEEEGNPLTGWSAILAGGASAGVLPASIYKAAHHGSATSQHQGIWDELLATEPTAIVAPWINGGAVVPNEQERQFIIERSAQAFTTATTRAKALKREPASRRMIREAAPTLKVSELTFGIVRLRHRPTDQKGVWRPELFSGAAPLPEWRAA